MAVIWSLPTWVWVAVAIVVLGACALIVRVLAIVFASLRDLADSLELSGRMLTSALESTRTDLEQAKQGLERIGSGTTEPAEEAWKDW